MAAETTPIVIERTLTRDILRGRYPVGSRLPTVRELAASFGVNPATIQRVVARLETRGLVTARQGSGLLVNDPMHVGDVSLLPQWLASAGERGEQAAPILADLLELRRIVASRLLARHREDILAELPTLLARIDAVATTAGEDLDALCHADLAFARELLRPTGNLVALAVLNTLGHVLLEQPTVARAMYADRGAILASMARVLDALRAGGAGLEARLEEILAEVDAATVARFAAASRRVGPAGEGRPS